MTLRFVIPRKPVSVNAAYARAGWGANRGAHGGKGFILTAAARDFKSAAAGHALLARQREGWPPPERVHAVALAVVTYNTRHDADAPTKLLMDAFERVLYLKDSVVRSVSAAKAKDGGLARIEVAVTLLQGAG